MVLRGRATLAPNMEPRRLSLHAPRAPQFDSQRHRGQRDAVFLIFVYIQPKLEQMPYSSKAKRQACISRRAYELKHRYGISVDQWDKMFAEQQGLCAICSDPLVNPQVDHIHGTKVVRALLCPPCNQALGLFQDNLDVLENAVAYLRSNQ